jgi:hypothetical protein
MIFQHSFTPQRLNLMCLTSSRVKSFGEKIKLKYIKKLNVMGVRNITPKVSTCFASIMSLWNKQWLCMH